MEGNSLNAKIISKSVPRTSLAAKDEVFLYLWRKRCFILFIHALMVSKTKETQSPALVGERPRGGGNESRANKLANPSEVALMCVLLVRPPHPSASSGGPTPCTGTLQSSVLCTSHFTMNGRGLIVARLNLRHSAELATSCSPWNPPWEVPQETCVAPFSPKMSHS